MCPPGEEETDDEGDVEGEQEGEKENNPNNASANVAAPAVGKNALGSKASGKAGKAGKAGKGRGAKNSAGVAEEEGMGVGKAKMGSRKGKVRKAFRKILAVERAKQAGGGERSGCGGIPSFWCWLWPMSGDAPLYPPFLQANRVDLRTTFVLNTAADVDLGRVSNVQKG